MTEQAWASVAIVFAPHPDLGEAVLLIERAVDPRDPWSGHLSFPGGKLEQGESSLQAALRESREEIGLDLQVHHYVDELPLGYAGRAQDLSKAVKPYLFRLDEIPELQLQLDEVAAVHWLKVEDFKRGDLHQKRTGLAPKYPQLAFPCFPLGAKVLWGFSYECLRQACNCE